jgi:hypothetical protein
VVCRWKPLNALNVVLRLVVMVIGLLVVADLRRTSTIAQVPEVIKRREENLWQLVNKDACSTRAFNIV